MSNAAVPARPIATTVIWLLVFASVVSWRKGVLFTGGVDTTVVAKACVALFAAAAALMLVRSAPGRRTVSSLPVVLVFSIVGISLIGAYSSGLLAANVVLVIRIALLAVTILLVLSVTETSTAIATMLAAMGMVGLFAAGTGAWLMLGHGVSRDRLGGGIPPLEPNELATLLLPPAIGLALVIARRGLGLISAPALLLFVGLIVWTGSRTALAVFVLGSGMTLFAARPLSRGIVVLLLGLLVGAYLVAGFTDVVGSLVLRGQGVARLSTLNSRTISWHAVLSTSPSSWSWWIGNGIAMKQIAVTGQYWQTQVFDSSWVSSIAQDGWVGTALLAVYVIGTVLAIAANRSIRGYAMPLAVTLVVRSVVENGLIESSVTFTIFFVLACVSWPGTAPSLAMKPRLGTMERMSAIASRARVLRYPNHWLARDGDGSLSKAPV